MDISRLMNRLMKLKKFTIEMELPENFNFSGKVPFDMSITQDKVVAEVLAEDYDEAYNKLFEYLYK